MGDKLGRLGLHSLVSLHWADNVVDFVFKTLSQSSRLWGTWVTNLVDNPLSIKPCPVSVTPLTRFPEGMLPTGLSGSWV